MGLLEQLRDELQAGRPVQLLQIFREIIDSGEISGHAQADEYVQSAGAPKDIIECLLEAFGTAPLELGSRFMNKGSDFAESIVAAILGHPDFNLGNVAGEIDPDDIARVVSSFNHKQKQQLMNNEEISQVALDPTYMSFQSGLKLRNGKYTMEWNVWYEDDSGGEWWTRVPAVYNKTIRPHREQAGVEDPERILLMPGQTAEVRTQLQLADSKEPTTTTAYYKKEIDETEAVETATAAYQHTPGRELSDVLSRFRTTNEYATELAMCQARMVVGAPDVTLLYRRRLFGRERPTFAELKELVCTPDSAEETRRQLVQVEIGYCLEAIDNSFYSVSFPEIPSTSEIVDDFRETEVYRQMLVSVKAFDLQVGPADAQVLKYDQNSFPVESHNESSDNDDAGDLGGEETGGEDGQIGHEPRHINWLSAVKPSNADDFIGAQMVFPFAQLDEQVGLVLDMTDAHTRQLLDEIRTTKLHCPSFRNQSQLVIVLRGNGKGIIGSLFKEHGRRRDGTITVKYHERWIPKMNDIFPFMDIHYLPVRLLALCHRLHEKQNQNEVSATSVPTDNPVRARIVDGVKDSDGDTWFAVMRHALSAIAAADDFKKNEESLKAEMLEEEEQENPGVKKRGSLENRLKSHYSKKLAALAAARGRIGKNLAGKFGTLCLVGNSLKHLVKKFGQGILAVMPLLEIRKHVLNRSITAADGATFWLVIRDMLRLGPKQEQTIIELCHGPGKVLIEAYAAGSVTKSHCKTVHEDLVRVTSKFEIPFAQIGINDISFEDFNADLPWTSTLLDTEIAQPHIFETSRMKLNPRRSIQSLSIRCWLRADAIFTILHLQQQCGWKVLDDCISHGKVVFLTRPKIHELSTYRLILPIEFPWAGTEIEGEHPVGFWAVEFSGPKRSINGEMTGIITGTWFDSSESDPVVADRANGGKQAEMYEAAVTCLDRLFKQIEVPINGVLWKLQTKQATFYGHINPEDCGIHVIRNAASIMHGNMSMDKQLDNFEVNRLRCVYRSMLLQYLYRLQAEIEKKG